VSVIDLDPASATYHQVVSTLTVPGGSEPYAVDFVSDGSLAYVACRWDTYVVDTASALSDPGNAVVAHLPGLSAPIDIFRHTASGKDLALMDLNGRVAVLDLSTDPLDPDTVGVLEAGVDIAGFRGADDKIFLSYMSSGDLWVVDTDNLLTSAALSMTRFDANRRTARVISAAVSRSVPTRRRHRPLLHRYRVSAGRSKQDRPPLSQSAVPTSTQEQLSGCRGPLRGGP